MIHPLNENEKERLSESPTKKSQNSLTFTYPSLHTDSCIIPLLNTTSQNSVENVATSYEALHSISSPSHESLECSTNELKKCKLCWEDISSNCMFKISSCQCSFCSKCLKEYLDLTVHEGIVHIIECPDNACPVHGVFKSSEIKSLLGPDVYKKYKKLKIQSEIDLNPFQSFCPSKNCDTIITLPKENFDTHKHFTSRPALCNKCNFKFCVLCKEAWHEKSTCVENLKHLQSLETFDGIRYDDSEDAQIKRCPFCFLPIERDGGCAQVKCKKCSHIFCWFCLACLDRDAFFFHFERGPCKNKLGHPRASILWHRIQVVTIFAGVGLLVLLASPFLLLAAPCVVCCKFKASREGAVSKRNKRERSLVAAAREGPDRKDMQGKLSSTSVRMDVEEKGEKEEERKSDGREIAIVVEDK